MSSQYVAADVDTATSSVCVREASRRITLEAVVATRIPDLLALPIKEDFCGAIGSSCRTRLG